MLLAREPVYLLEALGSDSAAAWHLVNFVFFQLGVYLIYRLARRWLSRWAAFASAALFSFQPMLWGHAFINPKDPPFLVFFLGAVYFGFEMVDTINESANPSISLGTGNKMRKILLAAFFLGIATSIRVLGPLAGSLVFVYSLVSPRRGLKSPPTFTKSAEADSPHVQPPSGSLHTAQNDNDKNLHVSASRWLKTTLLYVAIAIVIMLAAWPYLWPDPIARFMEVFGLMSENPTHLKVLFNGELYSANELPRRYLPFLLATTLTEPAWPLFIVGLTAILWKLKKLDTSQRVTLSLTLLWFLIPFFYVLLRRPPMYDGLRHFLFIVPPIFVFIGFAFEFLVEKTRIYWLRASLVFLILLPGIFGIAQLHPYEYTYYNSLIGGTSGVFRKYETDYWLTCYKEAVEQFNQITPTLANLFVKREAYIAKYYASEGIIVQEIRGALNEIEPGDYVLVNTRSNEDRGFFNEAHPVLKIRRGEALFCEIKQAP